jgi:hypothetical protein
MVRLAAQRAVSGLGDRGDAERVVIAVLPLRDATGQGDPEIARLAAEIAGYLSARLSAARVCQVVDPAQTERAVAELAKHGAPLYDGDAPSAPQIGRFKLANQLAYGAIQREGLVYTIVLNRMDVATLELVPGASATASGYRADLDRIKVEAVDRFVAQFR